MMSETIKELAAALAKAQGNFDHAKKDVQNDYFKSKYADLAACIDAAKIELSKNGLSVSQVTDFVDGEVILLTILMHSSGEFIKSKYPVKPIKTDPQAAGSALTYARRYCFCAITGIASDDDDGNAASNTVKKPEVTEQKQKPTAQKTELSKKDAYLISIQSAKTMPELVNAWSIIPKNLHKKYVADKDHKKIELNINACESKTELDDFLDENMIKNHQALIDKKYAEYETNLGWDLND